MKSLIILALLLICLIAFFITRPSQDSFVNFYVQQATANSGGFLGQALSGEAAKMYAKTFTYEDHYLWVNVKQGDKVAFTGALSHWFTRDASAAKPALP